MRLGGLLTLAGALALGQTKAPPEIRCDFRALALSAPITDAAYVTDRRPTPLLIPSDFFSAAQAYRGPAELTLGRLESTVVKARADDGGDAAARQADAAYAELAQEAADLVAGAAEGPAGEAQRRRAEEILGRAAEQAARAARLREAAQARRPAADAPAPKTGEVARPPGPTRFTPRGSVRLRDGGAYLLLVAEAPAGWRVTALDDTPGLHPFGTLRFINLTGRPLLLRQGGRDVALPDRRPVIHRPSVDEHGYAGLELRATDADSRPLRTMRVYPEKDARSTYLLVAEPAGGLTVKAAHERRAP